MAENYPAGTESIRNLTPTYIYFLVVKGDSIADDIPQKEYFVYRFIVSVSEKDGISQLTKYLQSIGQSDIIVCRSVGDIEYATGKFDHPEYKNSNKGPLQFNLREIPIYIQAKIRTIDFEKDLYQYGSKPIIRDNTSVILS